MSNNVDTFLKELQIRKEKPLFDIFYVCQFPHGVGTVLAFNLVSNHINGGKRRQRRSFSSNLLLHHMGPSEDYTSEEICFFHQIVFLLNAA